MDRTRWEFLVVCSDISVYKTITAAFEKMRRVVDYTSSTSTARGFIARRKIDGIFLDMELEGTLELIRDIRQGTSNRYAVIFALADASVDAGPLLNAGANFVVQKPLMTEGVNAALSAGLKMIEAERKRYERLQVSVPVMLKIHERQQQAITSNISRGGMAVRCKETYEPGAAVQFSLHSPSAGEITGRGQVAWANTEGFMGIKFYLLPDQQKQTLSTWLDKHQPRVH